MAVLLDLLAFKPLRALDVRAAGALGRLPGAAGRAGRAVGRRDLRLARDLLGAGAVIMLVGIVLDYRAISPMRHPAGAAAGPDDLEPSARRSS